VDIGSGTVGLITYMRTDSFSLAAEAVMQIRDHIKRNFEPEYLPKSPIMYKTKSKSAQEAHEAIRPTDIGRTPASLRAHLTPEQFKLYDMIWKRALACQMAPARFDAVSVDITVGGDANVFRATGQTLVFPGFIAVYTEGADDTEEEGESKLPVLEVGETLDIDKIFGEQHFTEPPPRYTEASLVKVLEEYGIGRPSTYASIISTLQDREYVLLDKKRFTPTDVGRVVNKFLTEHFTKYVDYGFTAELENELDEIAEGGREWIPVLDDFWQGLKGQIESKGEVERPGTEILDEACPKCGKPLNKRLGKRGSFIGCTGYPECDYTRNMDGNGGEENTPVVLGLDPDSGKEVRLLVGPYGPYVQLGEAEGKAKPKRMSVPPEFKATGVDLNAALQLLALPREVGHHPDTGKKIVANIGRFGPYLNHDGNFKSIPKTDSVFAIDLPRALEVLAMAKGKNALRVLGNHPQDGGEVAIYDGRYGAYVQHGKVRATLGKTESVDALELDRALELLAAKAEKDSKGTGKGKKPAARKSAAKKKAA
jgi:DNA topoisomerase-1